MIYFSASSQVELSDRRAAQVSIGHRPSAVSATGGIAGRRGRWVRSDL
jgi:hypothetical protein